MAKPQLIDFKPVSNPLDPREKAYFAGKVLLSTNKDLNKILLADKGFHDQFVDKLEPYEHAFSSLFNFTIMAQGNPAEQRVIYQELIDYQARVSAKGNNPSEVHSCIIVADIMRGYDPSLAALVPNPLPLPRAPRQAFNGPAFAPGAPNSRLGSAFKGFKGATKVVIGAGKAVTPRIAGTVAGLAGSAALWVTGNYTVAPMSTHWTGATPCEIIAAGLYTGLMTGGAVSAVRNVLVDKKPLKGGLKALAIAGAMVITPPVALTVRDAAHFLPTDKFFTLPSRIFKALGADNFADNSGNTVHIEQGKGGQYAATVAKRPQRGPAPAPQELVV